MLTLMGAFTILLLRDAEQERFFGKPKIEYTHFLQVVGFAYESGALVVPVLIIGPPLNRWRARVYARAYMSGPVSFLALGVEVLWPRGWSFHDRPFNPIQL